MTYLKYINVLLFLLLVSCSPDDNNAMDSSAEPSNLTVTIDLADDDSGNVVVTATANNAVEYHFYMGELAETDPHINDTGIYEYTYSALGTYQVEVRAYGAGGRFIKKVKQISVVAEAPAIGEGYSTPTEYAGMNLVFAEEFIGTTLNANNWTHEIGTGNWGWGNNELQYYRTNNTTVANGVLTIEARKEQYEGSAYTSSRIISQKKQSFKYGRIDIRAILPKGQGIWPALWMLGENISSVSWPSCGEIDIMELVGGPSSDNEVHGTCHWNNNGHTFLGDSYKLNSGLFIDEFHVFSIIWDEDKIQFFVDDNLYHTQSITNSEFDAFHKDFFFIMNVAVGGNWPGSPDNSTVFPQQMLVDYIRVFQKN